MASPSPATFPDREAEECFPPSLRFHFDQPRPADQAARRADCRRPPGTRRRPQMGLLKIIAGMLGVGLDDLAQREAQRRHRRLYAITAASVAGMLVTSGLAYTAIDARDDARDQRREAESLIGFMLGDLRTSSSPSAGSTCSTRSARGRSPIMRARTSPTCRTKRLAQRSRALTLMGEMAQARGDLDGALRRYREAMASTAEMARRAPNNPQYLFDHAQNVFWVGSIDYQRGNLDKAAAAFREYRRLADRMIALAPDKADYRLERIYADTNLGTVLMEQRRYRAAAEVYQESLEPTEALARKVSRQSSLSKAFDRRARLACRSARIFRASSMRRSPTGSVNSACSAGFGQPTRATGSLKRDELTARRATGAPSRLSGTTAPGSRRIAIGVRPYRLADAGQSPPIPNGWTLVRAPNLNGPRWNWRQTGPAEARPIAKFRLPYRGRTGRPRPQRNRVADRLQLHAWRPVARIAIRTGAAAEAVSLSQEALALARTERTATDRAFAVASPKACLATRSRAAASATRPAAPMSERWLLAPGRRAKAATSWPNGRYCFAGSVRRRKREGIANQLRSIGYRHPDYLQ